MNRQEWLERLGRLAIEDPNAARLMAVMLAHDDQLAAEVRAIFLRYALGISEAEMERCFAALEAAGLGKMKWIN